MAEEALRRQEALRNQNLFAEISIATISNNMWATKEKNIEHYRNGCWTSKGTGHLFKMTKGQTGNPAYSKDWKQKSATFKAEIQVERMEDDEEKLANFIRGLTIFIQKGDLQIFKRMADDLKQHFQLC